MPYISKFNKFCAFGSPKNLRQFNLASARVGFNCKEKDDDVKGNGNSVDFGGRIYDSRLGRWLSVDPAAAKYPDSSPFYAFGNNPIFFIDPSGETLRVGNTRSDRYIKQQIKDLKSLLPAEIRDAKNLFSIKDNVVTLDYGLVPDKFKEDKGVQLLNNLTSADETYVYQVNNKAQYKSKGSPFIRDLNNTKDKGISNVSKTPYSETDDTRQPMKYDAQVTISDEGSYSETNVVGTKISKNRGNAVFHELSESFYRTTGKLLYEQAHKAAINDEKQQQKIEAKEGTPLSEKISSENPGKVTYTPEK